MKSTFCFIRPFAVAFSCSPSAFCFATLFFLSFVVLSFLSAFFFFLSFFFSVVKLFLDFFSLFSASESDDDELEEELREVLDDESEELEDEELEDEELEDELDEDCVLAFLLSGLYHNEIMCSLLTVNRERYNSPWRKKRRL